MFPMFPVISSGVPGMVLDRCTDIVPKNFDNRVVEQTGFSDPELVFFYTFLACVHLGGA